MKKVSLLILIVAAAVTPAHAQDGQAKPCADERARQFDFWAGDWNVSQDGKLVGHNHISSIHGGCTLFEEYRSESGSFEGKSFNYFDPSDELWHQVWVDNSGVRLHLSGTYADGKMVLTGSRKSKSAAVNDRITWHNNDDGTVRQVWEVSRDEGKSWETVFDGVYERK
jgi:hypothetical protein